MAFVDPQAPFLNQMSSGAGGGLGGWEASLGSEETAPAGGKSVGRVAVFQREHRRADTTSAPCPSLWCHSGLEQVSIPRFCASDAHLRSSLQVPLSFSICVMGIILKSPPRAEGGIKRGSTARELEWGLAHCGGSESV